MHNFESWRFRRNERLHKLLHNHKIYKSMLETVTDKAESQEHLTQLLQLIIYESAFKKQIRNLVEKILEEYYPSSHITPGSKVYDKMRKDIETKYLGKTVAIDIEKSRVVGVGNTIEEAYNDALANSDKKKFYFRKVGKDYLVKV